MLIPTKTKVAHPMPSGERLWYGGVEVIDNIGGGGRGGLVPRVTCLCGMGG